MNMPIHRLMIRSFLAFAATLAAVTSMARAERIGTYNIRYDNPGDRGSGNPWTERAPVIAGLIRFHDFDVIATQEGFRHQIDDLIPLLPEHACSGHGRDDGAEKGEQIAFFYKKDAFELLDAGRFWLSETPDEPSVGWDADLWRICGWVKLERKSGGAPFYVFGVHFDHRGAKARQESARLVLRKIGEIAGDARVFLTGDFNADQSSETYRIIEESPRFADAFGTADIRYALNGTANRFDPAAMTESRIDHVFVPEGSRVRRVGILTDSYRAPVPEGGDASESGNFPSQVTFRRFEAKLPSDHFPVLAEVE